MILTIGQKVRISIHTNTYDVYIDQTDLYGLTGTVIEQLSNNQYNIRFDVGNDSTPSYRFNSNQLELI